NRPDGRLGDVRGAQLLFLVSFRVRRECRLRIDEIAQSVRGPVLGENAIRLGQHVEEAGELAGQVAEHAGVLRPLTGEEYAEFARRRTAAEEDAVGGMPVRPFCLPV